MADINRNDNSLIHADHDLKTKYLKIKVSEALNQIKAIDVQIDRINTVDLHGLELKKDELRKQIELLQAELNKLTSIEIN